MLRLLICVLSGNENFLILLVERSWQKKRGIALALEDWKILFEDDWKSLIIALYMVLVGYGVLVGIPVISTAWVTLSWVSQKLRLAESHGMDLGGLAAGSVFTAWIIQKWLTEEYWKINSSELSYCSSCGFVI